MLQNLPKRRCALQLLAWWWRPAIHVQTIHITVKGTVDEHCTCPVNDLYLFPDVTTVEPPEVAASAAEPSEVSVVTTY